MSIIAAAQAYAIGTDAALVPNPPAGYLSFGADVVGGVFSKTCVTPGGTDGLVTYLGMTIEQLQDFIAAMTVDSSELDFTYDDTGGTITLAIVAASIANAKLAAMAANTIKANVTAGSATPTDLALTANTFPARALAGNIAAKPITEAGLAFVAAASATVETALLDLVVAAGAKGLMSGADKSKLDAIASGATAYDNEQAQDAVGGMLTDTATIDFTYNDGPATVTADVKTDSIDNTLLANMVTDTVKGRAVGAGTGDPADLTRTQLTALLNLATTLLQGAMSTTDKKRMDQVYDAVSDFGFVGDLITTFDGVMNTGGASTTLTCASAPFTSTLVDGGKRITVAGAGAGGAQLTTTIASISSSSVAILTVGCSTSVSAKGVSFGTDNTTAISNMTTLVNTTNAAFPGLKIVFGRSATNAYGFPTPVVFNKPVWIEGIGGAFNTDNGDYTRIGGTRLAWWGTTSDGGVDFGAFFTIQPGAGATQAIKTPTLSNLWIDGRNGDQNAALYGVRLAGCHAPKILNVFIMDCRAAGLLSNATAISLSPTSDRGVLRPTFKDLFVRNLETFVGAITTPLTTSTVITLSNTGQNITVSATTMPVDASSTSYAWIQNTEGTRTLVKYTGGGTATLNVKCSVEDAIHAYVTIANAFVASATPQNAACVVLDGDTTANTNCGVCVMWQLTHGSVWGPAAIDIRNADSLHFISPYINGGDPTAEANPLINRTRKEGVTVAGSNTSIALAARNITITDGDPSSSTAAGITTLSLTATGALLLGVPGPNCWDYHQMANGARIPIVEGLTTSATQGKAGGAFRWNPNGGFQIGVQNVSIADQTPAAATLTHLLGSLITVPPQAFYLGTSFQWTMPASKTAAGTAARTFHVRLGAAGSTADAIIATITMPVGTAALDTGVFTVIGTMRVIGGSASLQTIMNLTHAGGSAALGGFTAVAINSPVMVGTPTTFNSASSSIRYLTVTLTTGAAEVITFQNVIAEVLFPGSP